MKVFKIILAVLAVVLLIYNVTIIDFSNPFNKESTIAIIGVVACICALLLLGILNLSGKIDRKIKEKKG
jgi:uncharacterized membrane protein